MNQPRDPLSELQRLTDHLAHLARNTTEINDSMRLLVPLVRLALLVWIVVPVLILILLIIAMIN